MLPLIDADVLRMEIGAVGQHVDDEGEIHMRSFDFVAELLDNKIREICELVWADQEPILFLTSCPRTHRILHRKSNVEFKPNFREAIATVKPYKGTRKSEKPKHYDNLTAYMLSQYKCVVAEGYEADDLLATYQTRYRTGEWHDGNGGRVETIICSRDKDLRMVEGNHFSWPCGKQQAFGPEYVTSQGYLRPTYDESGDKPKLTKVFGTGVSFFCYQLLVGDSVDNIPGIPGVGPVKALEILEGKTTYEEMIEAVADTYKAKYGEVEWAARMIEQGKLLWMCVPEFQGNVMGKWRLPHFLTQEETLTC